MNGFVCICFAFHAKIAQYNLIFIFGFLDFENKKKHSAQYQYVFFSFFGKSVLVVCVCVLSVNLWCIYVFFLQKNEILFLNSKKKIVKKE